MRLVHDESQYTHPVLFFYGIQGDRWKKQYKIKLQYQNL